jgi:sugar lactone lactonase YvrE
LNGTGLHITALPVPPALLGESPLWQPEQGALYWCDITGCALHRFVPGSQQHTQWPVASEPGCMAPRPDGTLNVAMRNGLWHFDPATGACERIAQPPYDALTERFNDGKADPQGRWWISTLYDPRTPPKAALYRHAAGRIEKMAGDATVGNGLAFSPDGRTLYWSDTTSHCIFAFDFDGADGSISRRRVWARFPIKQSGQDLATYGGRPDGAAVDVEGAYWVAMYEGQRLLRLSPEGTLLQDLALPVRCPTMPCFGGPDLCTLYITTARDKRPADELAAQPLAGAVLSLRVSVPGLPVNFLRP